MKPKIETVGFGAPAEFGAHMFRVQIPPARDGNIEITEDYGYATEHGGEAEHTRVILTRDVWSPIAKVARREFNARLRKAKLRSGQWQIGKNLVERVLGRELCVLAWAAEHATEEEFAVIGTKWAALLPPERWWLFLVTVAEAGLHDDHERGWRRALYAALSDGERTQTPRPSIRARAPDLAHLHAKRKRCVK